LLTTFSKPLANALRSKLASLVGNEPLVSARIVVKAVSAVGYDLYSERFGQPQIAPAALVKSLIAKAAAEVEGHRFSTQFLIGEWNDVVDAWQLRSWEDYRDVSRLGRKTRIGGKQREALWTIFERVRAGLRERGVVTWSDVFGRLADSFGQGSARPYDFAVIDEALWSYKEDSFLPHGREEEGDAEHQPILLTTKDTRVNGAEVLFLIDRAPLPAAYEFERIVLMFDGEDGEALDEARAAWKTIKGLGHPATYWQQDGGRWVKKA